MIDIHNHLIYGVDDGSPDLDTALEMAHEAARDGITHMVCTPHASEVYPYQMAACEERLAELRHLLHGEMELSLGAEMHLTADYIDEACRNFPRYSLNNKGYLLIEFPTMSIPQQMNDALYRLRASGYTLVIAHPERYPAITQKPQMLFDWVRAGCLLQVTASALYGRFGKLAEVFSNELLDRQWIHMLATDAHHPQHRPPHLAKAYRYVANRCGEQEARRLCVDNPACAASGRRLPDQPEPIGLVENKPFRFNTQKQVPARQAAAQPSFWSRLFGR